MCKENSMQSLEYWDYVQAIIQRKNYLANPLWKYLQFQK